MHTQLLRAVAIGAIPTLIAASAPAFAAQEQWDVSDYTAVRFAGNAEIEVVQGTQEFLHATGTQERIDRLEVSVDGGVLRVRDRGVRGWGWTDEGELALRIGVRTLNSLTASGDVEIEIASLESERFSIEASGDSEIAIDQITADQLNVELRGDSEFTVAGVVEEQRLQIMGDAEYEAMELASTSADVQIRGDGDVSIQVSEMLDVSVFGDGSIVYSGAPRIKQQVFGNGRIRSAGPG